MHLTKGVNIARKPRALRALIKQFIRPLVGYALCRQSSASDVASVAIQQQENLRLLGLALGQMREEQKLSLSGLSQASGIAENQIEELEAGELDPDLELLLTLSDSLGVQASALFIRTEEVAEASHEN